MASSPSSTFTREQIIERLAILRNKLEHEGSYVRSNTILLAMEALLTNGQKAFLQRLVSEGFVEHKTGFGQSQSNRCGWALVEAGLAEFRFGPADCFLQTQGFVPVKESRDAK